VPKHDDMIQAIHDAACHLGAQCLNEVEADPGTSDGANKSAETSSEKVCPEDRRRNPPTKTPPPPRKPPPPWTSPPTTRHTRKQKSLKGHAVSRS
jgi:hypothetical protein